MEEMEEMDPMEQQWATALTEAVSDLQAKTLAQDLMIETLIATHQHPIALRDTWDRLVAQLEARSFETKVRADRQDQVRSELTHQLDRLTKMVLRQAPRSA